MAMVNASAKLPAWFVTMTAMATDIGPVGLDMRHRAPPNTAAKKPTAIAPYIPAIAPKPEVTP